MSTIMQLFFIYAQLDADLIGILIAIVTVKSQNANLYTKTSTNWLKTIGHHNY
jgi:hypothetical protein